MTQTDLDKVKRAVIRKYPITAGLALHDVDVELSEEVETAAVVGEKDDRGVIHVKCIKANPEFFDKLSFSERVFVLAHESLHIAFKHFARSVQKPEKDAQKKYEEYCEKESDPVKRERMKMVYQHRYHNMWNIATDACINALLRKDGFSFPQNIIDSRTGKPMEFVDMEEGFHKCAEAIYDYLYQQQEEKEKQQNQNQQQDQQGNQSNQEQGSSSQDNSMQNDQNSQGQEANNQNNQSGQGEQSEQKEQDNSMQNNQNGQGEQNKQKEQDDSKSQSSGSQSNEPSPFDDIDIDNYRGFDSHESWTGEESEKELFSF